MRSSLLCGLLTATCMLGPISSGAAGAATPAGRADAHRVDLIVKRFVSQTRQDADTVQQVLAAEGERLRACGALDDLSTATPQVRETITFARQLDVGQATAKTASRATRTALFSFRRLRISDRTVRLGLRASAENLSMLLSRPNVDACAVVASVRAHGGVDADDPVIRPLRTFDTRRVEQLVGRVERAGNRLVVLGLSRSRASAFTDLPFSDGTALAAVNQPPFN